MIRYAAPLPLLVCLVLAGCTQYEWAKPGATAEQFSQDSRACALEAGRPRAPGAAKSRTDDDLYGACLSARGYRRNTYVPEPVTDWREWLGE